MPLPTLQAHRPLRLDCLRAGKRARITVIFARLVHDVNRIRVQAPTVGRRSAPVVLCPASDGKVTMGYTYRTGGFIAFYNPDVHRNRAFASAPFTTVNQQPQRDNDWKLTRGANGVGGGQNENFRRGSRSSCLHKH